MKCIKCGTEILSETTVCPECGAQTKKILNESDSENNKKKEKLPIAGLLVWVVAFILVGVIVVPNYINRKSYIEPQTTVEQTTEPTTKPKSEVAEIYETLKNELEDKGYSNPSYETYGNFQDYVNGAKKYPNDYFFVGTLYESWSYNYSNTRLYKNKDAIALLDKSKTIDATYLFSINANKKDKYGKEKAIHLSILVGYTDIESKQWHYWIFGDDDSLIGIVIQAISEKIDLRLVE